MVGALLVLLVAAQGAEQTTLPRQADTQPYAKRDESQGIPTDPLFDRERVATDDGTFILTAVESTRQATFDSQGAAQSLNSDALRDTARAIRAQNEATTKQLESLARRKGWRLPEVNPARASTLPTATPHRAGANFILNQINAHEATLAQFRAQIAGKGDADLKRTLKQALPGYEKNLARLLEARP